MSHFKLFQHSIFEQFGFVISVLKRLYFNEDAQDYWAKSLYISNLMQRNLISSVDTTDTVSVTYHDEEAS